MRMRISLLMMSVLLAFPVMGQVDAPAAGIASADDAITYLSRTWFHKGENLNLLRTPGEQRLAVDNLGRTIADESLAPETKNIRFLFDTIHERDGWSQVWRINMFARLGRPDLAYRQVRVALPGFHDHLIWQSKNQIDAPSG